MPNTRHTQVSRLLRVSPKLSRGPSEGEVQHMERSLRSYAHLVDVALHADSLKVRVAARDKVLVRLQERGVPPGMPKRLISLRRAIDDQFVAKSPHVDYGRTAAAGATTRHTKVVHRQAPASTGWSRRLLQWLLAFRVRTPATSLSA